jgi:hypothetical protein
MKFLLEYLCLTGTPICVVDIYIDPDPDPDPVPRLPDTDPAERERILQEADPHLQYRSTVVTQKTFEMLVI